MLDKDGQEAHQFISPFSGLRCDQGVLLTPYLITLVELGLTSFAHHLKIDASYYGDVLVDSWGVYTFGIFNPSRLMDFLFPSEPNTLGVRYTACEWPDMEDPVGFQQVFDIPGSVGKEIRLCGQDGDWIYSHHSLATALSGKTALQSGRLWPLMSDTGTAPSAGQRIVILGGLACFSQLDLPDDGSAIDTVWRSSPSAIWCDVLFSACETWSESRIPADVDSPNLLLSKTYGR